MPDHKDALSEMANLGYLGQSGSSALGMHRSIIGYGAGERRGTKRSGKANAKRR